MSHIFISYSHVDADYAHKLAGKLQSEGFEVWIDARLDYGSQWPQEIQTQLDACSAFILIMSRHSYSSEWVQNELSRAKRKNKPIFPLLLGGDEPWLSVETIQYYDVRNEDLPDRRFYEALEHVISHGQKTSEPLTGDSKRSLQTKSLSISKIWIGIIGAAFVCVIGILSVVVALKMLSTPPESPTLNPKEDSTDTPMLSTPTPTIRNATATSEVVQVMPTFTPMNIPRIYDFQACPAPCNGRNSTNNFAEAITKIYIQFNYENLKSDAPYTRTWSLGDREWIRYTCNWDGPSSGTEVLRFTEPKGLASGTWTIRVTLDNVVLLEDEIVVVGNWDYWDPAGTINACHGTN